MLGDSRRLAAKGVPGGGVASTPTIIILEGTMSWVAIRRFSVGDPDIAKTKMHWEGVVEDLGLLVESNVLLEEGEEEVRLYVSEAVNEFFQGQPGRQYG